MCASPPSPPPKYAARCVPEARPRAPRGPPPARTAAEADCRRRPRRTAAGLAPDRRSPRGYGGEDQGSLERVRPSSDRSNRREHRTNLPRCSGALNVGPDTMKPLRIGFGIDAARPASAASRAPVEFRQPTSMFCTFGTDGTRSCVGPLAGTARASTVIDCWIPRSPFRARRLRHEVTPCDHLPDASSFPRCSPLRSRSRRPPRQTTARPRSAGTSPSLVSI